MSYYENIPKKHSLDSMEGLDNGFKNPEVEYDLNADSFCVKIREIVAEETKKDDGENTNAIHKQIERSLNSIGRKLLYKKQVILAPPESKEDNEKLLEIIRWLQGVVKVKPIDFFHGAASLLNMNFYSREELLEIIDSPIGSDVEQAVFLYGGNIIFNGKNNEEIVEFATNLIRKRSLDTNIDTSDEREKYFIYSAHQGYKIWDSAKKYIVFDKELEKTLKIGENLGDQFVWEKILDEKRQELESLSKDKRREILVNLIQSIVKKGNIPDVDISPIKLGADIRIIGSRVFGGGLSRKIEEVLLA